MQNTEALSSVKNGDNISNLQRSRRADLTWDSPHHMNHRIDRLSSFMHLLVPKGTVLKIFDMTTHNYITHHTQPS